MTIDGINNPLSNVGPVRSATDRPARAPREREAQAPAAKATPRDSVQISAEGRARAAESVAEAPGLSPERAEAIRAKILEGAYNTVEMADEVARRILQSGDL
jgi:anti-sigma28 factor (negative regulator of flagellin synthesis)